MTDRRFRLLLGVGLLGLLYFDAHSGIKLLIGYLVFEGLTNLRLTRLFHVPGEVETADGPAAAGMPARFFIEAEQVWRLCSASLLSLSVVFQPDVLWWVAWFIAFTVLGAGVSGVCPLLVGLRLAGFR